VSARERPWWPPSWRSGCGGSRMASSLLPLFDLAAGVNDKGHCLAVFHRLDRNAFGGGSDISDLRIAGGLKLGYQFLLGQGMGGRKHANDHQTAKNRLRDCS